MSLEHQPGSEIGAAPRLLRERYELGEEVAQGAFFVTYRGRDLHSGRPIAIKLLRPEFQSDEALAERLVREIGAVRVLQHPSIAAVFDVWQEGGRVVVVTEFVRGIDLKERIRRVAPFPLRVAIDIAVAIAQALAHAHQAGFVHGDLRPENVIVTPDGHVKVTDFGVGAALTANDRMQPSALPRAAYYLPPEVAQGRPPDSRSDTYALGVILFEMLCGGVPYDGDSPLAIAAKHLHDPPPSLRRRDAGIPLAVDGICQKAMQKSLIDRYESPAAMLTDLHAVREALIYRRSLNWTPMPLDPPPAPATVANPMLVAEARRRYFSRPVPADEVEEDDGPSWKLLALGALGIVGVILVGFLVATLMFQTPPDVQVPSLMGKTESEARRTLERLGFAVEVVSRPHEQQPEGTVYSQQPEGRATAKKGSTVTLYVSQGSPPLPVPDVVGERLTQAQRRLREAGFTVGDVTEEYSAVTPRGLVISQDPGGNSQARKGTPVDLVVSKGEEPPPEDLPVTVQPMPPAGTAPPPGPVLPERRYDLVVRIPARGTEAVRIRVLVTDEDGSEHIAYDQMHQPGEEIATTVSGRGLEGRIRIRVYFDDRLVHDQRV